MDRDEILAQLSQKLMERKCHTMATILTEEHIDNVPTENMREKFMNSEFMRACRRHSKSQDTDADLVDLVNFVIQTPVPDAIGEMFARRIDVPRPGSRKVRVTTPGEAKATNRGKPSRGKGTRNRFITIDPEDELESHEAWDAKFLEDADWNVAQEESAEIVRSLREEMSQKIINTLDDIAASKLNGGALYSAATAGTWSFNDIVDMRAQMLSRFVRPTVMGVNPLQMADMLKDEAFQNSFRYGDMVNKAEGYMGMVMGMDIYESPQIESGHVYMLNPEYVLLYGVRRYEMMDSYEEVKDGKKEYGICVSTRYDLKEGEPKYYSRCENA